LPAHCLIARACTRLIQVGNERPPCSDYLIDAVARLLCRHHGTLSPGRTRGSAEEPAAPEHQPAVPPYPQRAAELFDKFGPVRWHNETPSESPRACLRNACMHHQPRAIKQVPDFIGACGRIQPKVVGISVAPCASSQPPKRGIRALPDAATWGPQTERCICSVEARASISFGLTHRAAICEALHSERRSGAVACWQLETATSRA
jgi:hypothetical protein